MPYKPTGEPNGRPRRDDEIDLDAVHELALDGCTVNEIAGCIGFSHSTFAEIAKRDPVETVIREARMERRKRLRKLQWQAAESGNPALLIWLGKQELEQRDISRHELAGVEGEPIEMKHDGTVGAKPGDLAEIASGLASLGAFSIPDAAEDSGEAADATKH